MNYSEAKIIAGYIIANLSDSCLRIEEAGSLRRKKAVLEHDIEIVCIPKPGAPRPEFGQKVVFTSWLDLSLSKMEDTRLLRKTRGAEKYRKYEVNLAKFGITALNPFYLDLFIVKPETWGVQFTLRTGPHEFSHRCVTSKKFGGLLPDDMKVEGGRVWNVEHNVLLETPEEIDFLNVLELGWIEPKDRNA